MMRATFICLCLLAAACANEDASSDGAVSAENIAVETTGLPDTDIYLADLSVHDLAPEISNMRPVVTGPGYANQPAFVADDAFLFTEENDSGKTDLWRFDAETGTRTRLTDSADRSEYSPKPAPDGGVSYIQESPDGEMTRVHLAGEAVIEFAPLGYYEWLDGGQKLGVFYRSDVPELHLVDVATGENTIVIAGVGRALQASPDGAILYFTATSESGNQLYAIGPSGKPSAVLEMPGEGEDFRIIFNEAGLPLWVLATEGNNIRYHAYPGAPGESWPIVGLFPGIGTLSRIAVNADHTMIAIVAAVE